MNPKEKLRVLVVEDHFLARLAVSTLVSGEADMCVVAQAETGPQAVKLFQQHRPDVVLMDLRLPELDGTAAISAIVRFDPDARILVLSNYESEEDVARALAVGARGYLKKDVEGSLLGQSIRRIANGEKVVPADIRERLEDRSGRAALSRREQEVLRHIYKGLSNAEVAAELNISEGTVRIHVSI